MFINIAEEQIRSGVEAALKNHSDFFNEYFSTLENREEFLKSIHNILKTTDADLANANISLLSKKLSLLILLIKSAGVTGVGGKNADKKLIIPDFVFFLGLNNFDGHGLLIRGKPYAFFNMTLINRRLEDKSFVINSQLLHETFHAIHYFYSPSFYLKNYTSIEHRYLKIMIAEGIASYFTLIAGGKKHNLKDAFWFGLVDEEHFKKWVENCALKKSFVYEMLKKVIAGNSFDPALDALLFYVLGAKQEELILGRFGYYYGFEVVRQVVEKAGTKVLYMPYEEFTEHIWRYFESNDA